MGEVSGLFLQTPEAVKNNINEDEIILISEDQDLVKKLEEIFGFNPDWVVPPLDDCREFW